MHRFYLPPDRCHDSTLILSEGEAHHALHVLRLRVGDRVIVVDGEGRECLCEIRAVDRHRAALAVLQRQAFSPLPCQLTLLQAVPKGKTMDWIIEKATELGVRRVVPIQSERSVPQWGAEALPKKTAKWRLTAIEAMKQCGSAWLPQVDAAVTPRGFLARGEPFDLMLVASLQPDAQHLRAVLTAFEKEHRRRPHTVAVWIGPEGDFTPAELHTIKAAGAWPMTLGPLVLRTETAATCALAVLNYELQHL
jgi:16S rRNA (uracil1498-N3)-methyltransferase